MLPDFEISELFMYDVLLKNKSMPPMKWWESWLS